MFSSATVQVERPHDDKYGPVGLLHLLAFPCFFAFLLLLPSRLFGLRFSPVLLDGMTTLIS